jgi:hypothetical protein
MGMTMANSSCSLDAFFADGRTLVAIYSGTDLYKFLITLVEHTRMVKENSLLSRIDDYKGNTSS